MGRFVTVGASERVAEGDVTGFEADGLEVAVVRADGELHAFSDICTHRRCNLSLEGDVDGTTITCGCHGSSFDVVTGSVLASPAEAPLLVFPVRELDGRIEIEIES
jgi:nitrite reductase/ring-hydroxylating ferredoxin subunit